jgi:hypothetical protein
MSAAPHAYRHRQLTQEAAPARRRRRPAEHGAAGPGPRAVLDDAGPPRPADRQQRAHPPGPRRRGRSRNVRRSGMSDAPGTPPGNDETPGHIQPVEPVTRGFDCGRYWDRTSDLFGVNAAWLVLLLLGRVVQRDDLRDVYRLGSAGGRGAQQGCSLDVPPDHRAERHRCSPAHSPPCPDTRPHEHGPGGVQGRRQAVAERRFCVGLGVPAQVRPGRRPGHVRPSAGSGHGRPVTCSARSMPRTFGHRSCCTRPSKYYSSLVLPSFSLEPGSVRELRIGGGGDDPGSARTESMSSLVTSRCSSSLARSTAA